jgi:hypothetical protein
MLRMITDSRAVISKKNTLAARPGRKLNNALVIRARNFAGRVADNASIPEACARARDPADPPLGQRERLKVG